MATCVDLAGTEYPSNVPPCEGTSLLPLFKGNSQPIHKTPIFWEHEGNAAVRWGQWKLVREYQKPWELYDLEADRAEMQNLAETNLAKKTELIGLWKEWADENQVAHPQRFNMYEFLNSQKKAARKKSGP